MSRARANVLAAAQAYIAARRIHTRRHARLVADVMGSDGKEHETARAKLDELNRMERCAYLALVSAVKEMES